MTHEHQPGQEAEGGPENDDTLPPAEGAPWARTFDELPDVPDPETMGLDLDTFYGAE
jgi:hypothetical protein